MTKKLLTFILFASGMFSFTVADAQCVCYCTNNGQPRFNAECYTKDNGDLGCRRTRCRDGVTDEQDNEAVSLFVSPNPVSAITTVSFYVGQTEKVSLKIFDLNGRLVTTLADASFEAGEYEITFNETEVNAGIYFVRFQAANYSEDQKLIVAN